MLALGGAGIAWWSSRPPPLRFETVTVDEGLVEQKVVARGALSAPVDTWVGSGVAGRVSKIEIAPNARVVRGQLLARVEPVGAQGARELARTNHTAALGNVDQTKNQLKRAEAELTRTQELAKKKQANASRLDISRATVELARAAVAAAEALEVQAQVTLEQAELDLSNSVIRAPTDGFVVSQDLQVGQLVTTANRKGRFFGLATRLETLRLEVKLPAAEAVKLEAGAYGTFALEGGPDRPLRATVKEILPPEEMGGEAPVVLDAENPDGTLVPGMAVTLIIVHARRPRTLRLPHSALAFQPDAAVRHRFPIAGDPPDRTTVWVLDADDRPARRPVVLGIAGAVFTEVVGGSLGAGDKVITRAWVSQD
ncbi:MAG: efflux RND transporter periplasmic adaptor subunit, partial [Deltaproteobacteria bacterium]|nr:efflux RND transporter periplasmic adaptor subunit [Deltaproteobacteria bacterium]